MRNSTSLAMPSRHTPKSVSLRVVSSVSERSPCDGCERYPICRKPCDALERLLEPVRTRGREILSPRAVEFRAQTAWDPVEAEERKGWTDLRERYLAHIRPAVRMLRGKERVIMEQQLDAPTSKGRNSKQTKVTRDAELGVATRKVAANLEVLHSLGKCMEPGCAAPVNVTMKVRKELQGYCELHRQLRSLSLAAGITPDRAGVAKLVRAQDHQARFVDVTPELALALLELNRKNRRLHLERVATFERDMRNGDWQRNNQGIGIGRDKTLYDGQHRLWAIVKSGLTVPMLISTGLSEQARPTIDQGRPRSVGDTLQMFDDQQSGTRVVSWLRAIHVLHARRPEPMSHAVARRELLRYEGSVAWLLANGPRAVYRRAPVVGALVYAHAAEPAPVEEFVRRYITGANLREGSPVLALRNYVTEHAPHGKDWSRLTSLKTLKCVLAEMRGEQLSRLFPSEEGYDYFRQLHEAS